MANWISRTPDANGFYRYRRSSDPPPAQQAAWLRLGAGTPVGLTGVADPARWKVTGDSVGLKPAADEIPWRFVQKIYAINATVAAKIAAGFSYGGLTFSLSPAAQRNLQDLKARAADLSWPMTVENVDDTDSLDLADQATGATFYAAAFDAVRAHRAAGRTRKAAARAARDAGDLAALLAVEESW